jgi:hypothetical protein
MSTTRPKAGRSGIERSSCLAISTPPLQLRRRRLMWFGGGLGIHGREARRRVRRCLGDNCQSSAQTGPVGSRQVRLAGDSGECGLVGCSRAWWNDQQNDHQGKQRGLGCVTAEPRPQLQADKAYDIAGRPRCAAEESFPRTGDNRLTDRSTVGDVNSRLWVSRGTGG